MKNKLKNLFTEQVKELLSEDTLNVLEQAINTKIDLHVESALIQQDELFAGKLEELIDKQDKSYANRLMQVAEKVDMRNAKKLQKVIIKADKMLTKEAANFKNELIGSISDYIELYLENAIPIADIEQATKNKTAMNVLNNLRKVLAVNAALMKSSVKDAITEGKQIINTSSEENEKLLKENKALKEAYNKTKTELFLEQKTADMVDKKKDFLRKVLSDKPYKFIEENFEYTASLFDKKEKERIEDIKTEAFANRKVKHDIAPTEVLNETTTHQTPEQKELQQATAGYLDELGRIR